MLKNIRIPVLAMSVLLVLCYTDVRSQSLDLSNLQSVNVDDLTDSQILNYINQARERGLSQSQMEALAREKGVSEVQIMKLRSRILSLEQGQQEGEALSVSTGARQIGSNGFLDSYSGNRLVELTDSEKRIFGFELFRRSSLSFAPNLSLPTPTDYELGPGDELIVDLWGSTQQFLRLPVSQEGTVRPNKLGPIYVNGLTIEKATERLIGKLSQVYSGLKPKDGRAPSIFSQVSLGNIRTISVEVVGAAEQPGLFSLPSLSTVYTAVHAAGGPTEQGSFRQIRLVRDNKVLSTIDIYHFLTTGVKSGDIRLRQGDVIIIPPVETRVDLRGAVKSPGLFELKSDEPFSKVLNYASGFTNMAFKEIVTIKRNGDSEKEILDVRKEDFDTFKLSDGDVIDVGQILNRFSNRVVLNGAVLREGEYQLTDGLTLKNLIEKAGGLRGDAFTNRASIYRLGQEFEQSVITVNLTDLINGSVPDIALQKEDVIKVNSVYDLKEEYFVTISGETLEGGVYPYFEGMTTSDLVLLAGGLKRSASESTIEISRIDNDSDEGATIKIISVAVDKALSQVEGMDNVLLEPFDKVFIRRSPNYLVQEELTVEGEVMVPGLYTIIKKDERISEIINRAQGFTSYAYPKGAILIRQTEFSNNPGTNQELNASAFEALRNKILDGESQIKNNVKSELLERIDLLQRGVDKPTEYDREGSRLKRDMIESFSKNDSLVRDFNFNTREPVALDLDLIMANPGSKFDLIVKPGDIISIPAELETVRVGGEVTSALNIRYDKSYGFKDYVDRSGGFLSTAQRGRSFVQYPNGERKGVRRFLFFKKYPRIEPGSTILVGKKSERRSFNVQSAVGVASSLAALALIIDRIGN